MRIRLAVTALLVAMIFASFVYVTILIAPSAEKFLVLFLAWASVPALVSSINMAKYRLPISSAITAGIVGMLIFNYMFWRHRYFLPAPSPSFPAPNGQLKLLMAFVFSLISVVLSTVCGAFTYIVCKTIDRSNSVGSWTRIWIGTRKGFTYSLSCAVLTLPVLYLLLPPNGPNLALACAGYLFGGVTLGTTVGFLVGTAY